jgi:hypothetical protein
MRYACEMCRFRIVPFWTASECPRERAYDVTPNLDPVEMSENSGVILQKFRPDPNRASRHKHTLSVTLGWV